MVYNLIRGCGILLLTRRMDQLTFAEKAAVEQYFNQYPGSWGSYLQMALYVIDWLRAKHRRTGGI